MTSARSTGGMASDTPDMIERVLGSGVLAHIDHGLPRNPCASFEARMDPTATPARLTLDYRRADVIFAGVTHATADDIGAAIRATAYWDEALGDPRFWSGSIISWIIGGKRC